jgi:hypothetical protein
MRRIPLAFALLAVAPLASAVLVRPARAQDGAKVVKAADVPKSVVDALEKKYPKCAVSAWEREAKGKRVTFEATIEVAARDKDGKETKRSIDVAISDSGKILKEEETIAASALPEAVRKGIEASKFAKGKVLRVVRIVKDEKADAPLFEVLAELEGKRVEFLLDAAGKVQTDDDDDDDGDEDEGDDEDEDEEEDDD